MDFRTCRFCKKSASDDDLLKYGVRHYAHPDCFLTFTPDPFANLHDWQIRSIPALVLKKHGLLDHPRVKQAITEIESEIAEVQA